MKGTDYLTVRQNGREFFTNLPEQLEICARNLDGYPCRGVMHRRGLDNTLPYCQKCGSQDPGVMFIIRRATMREGGGIIARVVDCIRRSRAWLVSAWTH